MPNISNIKKVKIEHFDIFEAYFDKKQKREIIDMAEWVNIKDEMPYRK